METSEKDVIRQRVAQYIAKYPSRNKAAASLGISAATLSAILNGKYESISDDMWKALQARAGGRGGWQIVETSAYQEITAVLQDAQAYRNVRWVTGEAGCGKTTAAELYSRENREVFTVLCDEDMKKGDFVREIARRLGIRTAGCRLREVLDMSMAALVKMDSPLLVFDEGDKLNDNVFHYFINIYNRLEGKCGIVFLSTDYIRHRIENGLRYNKKGYNEIYSRIGRDFYELEETSAVDVAAICKANGLQDKRTISEIVKETEGRRFDLRVVRKAVHKHIRMSQVD